MYPWSNQLFRLMVESDDRPLILAAEQQSFEHEEQCQQPTYRHRKISGTDRQPRQGRDRLAHGLFAQLAAMRLLRKVMVVS